MQNSGEEKKIEKKLNSSDGLEKEFVYTKADNVEPAITIQVIQRVYRLFNVMCHVCRQIIVDK